MISNVFCEPVTISPGASYIRSRFAFWLSYHLLMAARLIGAGPWFAGLGSCSEHCDRGDMVRINSGMVAHVKRIDRPVVLAGGDSVSRVRPFLRRRCCDESQIKTCLLSNTQ